MVTAVTVLVGFILKTQFGTDWLELAGFTTGVVSVYLVAVEHIINWPVGLVNVTIYGWIFYKTPLYADMSLQIFFFVLSVIGWYQWAHGGDQKTELPISRIEIAHWGWIALALIVGTAIYTPIITHFKGSVPFIDSVLTVGSIIAQVLLNQKKLENWIIWIALDICYIPLYISKHYIATAILYAIFLALAASGLVAWTKTYRSIAKS